MSPFNYIDITVDVKYGENTTKLSCVNKV